MATDVVDQSPIEFLEDCIRQARAKRDAIQPRGFDSIKARAAIDAEIDDYLEDLLAAHEGRL
jgi:hypothetical protein